MKSSSATAAKRKGRNTARSAEPEPVLVLKYSLAELPTSQHRAGLAGFVLLIRHVHRGKLPKGAVLDAKNVDTQGAIVRLNLSGLRALFDEAYAASRVERQEPRIRRHPGTKADIRPLRTAEVEVIDPRTKRVKKKKVYFYPVIVPRGGFLLDHDPTRDGGAGLWIKLWRDMIWATMRGVPTTRRPFEQRARKEPVTDAEEAFRALLRPETHTVPLPSTYCLGAMEETAECVPFRDRARMQLLLHFWPYVAQVYLPSIIDRGGTRQSVGYALAVPDVANLEVFCDELPPVLTGRGVDPSGFRPREAVIDLALEAGLDLLRRLQERVAHAVGGRSISDLVLGIDVFHLEKRGNSVVLLGSGRVAPVASMIDEYARVQRLYWDPDFRRRRMANVLAGKPWYERFDAVFETTAQERTIGSNYFRHDAREAFDKEVGRRDMSEGITEKTDVTDVERLIYQFVRVYVSGRLKAKFGLSWNEVKGDERRQAEYAEKRAKIAKDAFLAVRSRTGEDFVSYFASTLASVPHHLNTDQFAVLARALKDRTEDVRTLTLLALSAHA